jgi:hypothetical protein
MSALKILIIRHAEKPDDPTAPWPGPSFTEDGKIDPDDRSLVIRGWQRAGSWAALFGTRLGGDDFPQPATIYGMDPDATKGKDTSRRPFETISPLAGRLSIKPITKYAMGDESDLVKEIIALTGIVLICWEHKHIYQKILPAIAKDQDLHNMPTNWNADRFDVVLRFDRAKPKAPWSFKQQFPRLLSGDTDVPLPCSVGTTKADSE